MPARHPARWLTLLLALALAPAAAGCERFPRDMADTTERVQASATLRCGIVAGDGTSAEAARAAADRLAETMRASAECRQGTAESLLPALARGELDAVFGDFAKASPWKRRVAFGPPVAARRPDDETPVLRAALRKGENRWLMHVARLFDGGGA